uniref:Uncharacterized protein n=1 Tax=Lactuca sativa TaxID=4236 RepID=A0A9R1W6N1_LACSA|nr:hypothetical protein LSAT_V11C300118820 [Lactuca sativa]
MMIWKICFMSKRLTRRFNRLIREPVITPGQLKTRSLKHCHVGVPMAAFIANIDYVIMWVVWGMLWGAHYALSYSTSEPKGKGKPGWHDMHSPTFDLMGHSNI